MLKKFLISFSLLVIILYSCSEVPANSNSSSSEGAGVPKNSFLVIDEANMYLKYYNLSTEEVGSIVEVGNAANDIEIDGDFAYIVVSTDNKLLKIDLRNKSLSTLSFPSGSNPYNLVIDSDKIYVTLSVSNKLSVVSKSSFSIVTNIDLKTPGYPEGVRFDSNKIYIATSSGWNNSYTESRVEIYSRSDYSFITNISLTYRNPQGLWIDGSDLYIACTGSYDGTGKALKMSTTDYSVSELSIPSTNATFVAKFGTNICVIESLWGGSGGIFINNTNLLVGKGLKEGIAEKDGFIYVSEAYGGTKSYRINLSDYSITEIPLGGGDIAIYK